MEKPDLELIKSVDVEGTIADVKREMDLDFVNKVKGALKQLFQKQFSVKTAIWKLERNIESEKGNLVKLDNVLEKVKQGNFAPLNKFGLQVEGGSDEDNDK